jgi:hypothetical protein
VNYAFEQSEGVTIILSTLCPNAKPIGNTYVDIVNEEIRQAYCNRLNRKVQLAEMSKDWSE